jgi:hypothetical protein
MLISAFARATIVAVGKRHDENIPKRRRRFALPAHSKIGFC